MLSINIPAFPLRKKLEKWKKKNKNKQTNKTRTKTLVMRENNTKIHRTNIVFPGPERSGAAGAVSDTAGRH